MLYNIDAELLNKAFRYANTQPAASLRRYANKYIQWLREGAVGIEPGRGRAVTKVEAAEIRFTIDSMGLWEPQPPRK